MKIMFMGTPDFAVSSLKAISDIHDVVCVVTKPDMPFGRGHKSMPPPIKVWALEKGLDVCQPESLKNGEFQETLEKYGPDIIVVVAYGKILPRYVLEFPKYGCINVHASLLPQYRGAAPIQRAIINGDTISGVCTMKMVEELDAGDILDVVETKIYPNETSGELFNRLSDLGAQLLLKTLEGNFSGTAQNVDKVTFAPPLTKEEAKINWKDSAENIVNLIRGTNPSPIAHTKTEDGRAFKIYRVVLADDRGVHDKCGQVLGLNKEQGLLVTAGVGTLCIEEFQESGGKRMAPEAYLCGKNPINSFVN